MENAIKREEWDFSGLSSKELLPALFWEARREWTQIEQDIANARAWIAGKLSTKRAPMPKDKRTGRRPRYNTNRSEAEIASARASWIFQDFIPFGESLWIHKRNPRETRAANDRWLAGYLRPLVDNCDFPWLCLPEPERQRLCEVWKRIEDTNVVRVGTWRDAVATYKKEKPDDSQPLRFSFSRYTSVLLTIDWRSSKKRILAAIGRILDQCGPLDETQIEKWDGRGRKDRDVLVMLERFAIMRLLHHYTLSELKLRLPDAWKLYGHRKWYDERRRGLKDFRDLIPHGDAQKYFPKSWETKAHRSRAASPLPTK